MLQKFRQKKKFTIKSLVDWAIIQCELVATLDQHRPKRIVCARFFRILGVMVHKCAHAEGILTKIRLDASSDFQWDHQ